MRFLTLLLFFILAAPVYGQSHFDQDKIAEIVHYSDVPADSLETVSYSRYVLGADTSNWVVARNLFYIHLGAGDGKRGFENVRFVELINRRLLRDIEPGDTLVIPDTFGVDFRAYSPFPLVYEGAADYSKLVVLHREIQAFAAYEFGELIRWGPINTGASSNPTPVGRFNMNWRQEHRISSLSPPGEEWHMWWVVNVHAARGIHMHQYDMPAGGPASHGCIRLIDQDAQWIYNWGEMADEVAGPLGTTVIIIGDQPEGRPVIFNEDSERPALNRVTLPADPAEVPAGTWLQRRYGVRK